MTAITGLTGEQGWPMGGDMAELKGLYPGTWAGAWGGAGG